MTAAAETRRWTREEFYRLADLGFFVGQKAERLEGQIVVQSPQNWPHSNGVCNAHETLHALMGDRFWVRMQLPLELGQESDPEPDVSVVPGRRQDYAGGHPTAAALVVEVSDSTLATDRGWKQRLYAAAGVPEYWIVNLPDGQLEVYRRPEPGGYADRQIRRPGDAVAPLADPATVVAVADLFG